MTCSSPHSRIIIPSTDETECHSPSAESSFLWGGGGGASPVIFCKPEGTVPCGVRRGWCGGSPLLLTGFRSLNVGRTESLGLSLVSTDTSEGSAICSDDFPASLLCVTINTKCRRTQQTHVHVQLTDCVTYHVYLWYRIWFHLSNS